MEVSLNYYNNTCRCCLEDLNSKAHLKLTKYVEKRFLEFTSTQLSSSLKLPSMICLACNELLSEVSAKRKIFIENQELLQNLLVREFAIVDCDIKEEHESDGTKTFATEDSSQPPEVKIEAQILEPFQNAFEFNEADQNQIVKKPRLRQRRKYQTQQALHQATHQTTKSSKATEKMDKRKSRYKLYCDQCDFKCREPLPMIKHKWKAHEGPKPPPEFFICEICSKCFKARSLFLRHSDMHNQKIRYFCDNCDFKTHARSDIQAHLLVHLPNDDPRVCFKCDYEGCNSTFRFPVTLRHHKNSVHLKILNFECHLCPKGFVNEHRRRKHIQFVHQKLRNVACDVVGCSSAFFCNAHLARHKRNVHKMHVERMGRQRLVQ